VNFTSELFINSKGEKKLTFTNDKSQSLTTTQPFSSLANKFESLTILHPFSALKETNQITFQKEGKGHLYYDITMKYYLPSLGLPARDEGFLITKTAYDFNAYRIIQREKNTQWQEYQNGNRRYSELTYPNDIFSYLQPLTEYKV
jgi:hypothetical protein